MNRVTAVLLRSIAFLTVAMASLTLPAFAAETEHVSIATFDVDVTPPLGSPVAYAAAKKIEDPLTARGIVLLGAGKPIVLCAVDWIGISNSGHLVFREKLAVAAGTTPDRVTVHALHQHDGPRCDFRAEEIMESRGFGGARFDTPFCRDAIERTAAAIREALPQAKPVTHLGIGRANVEKVASNRRILGPNGKVAIVRYSKSTDPKSIEAPEGLIDPELKLISFWNNETPIASLTYYATHPQSYYGQGEVTSEFVGLARARRDTAQPGVTHVHFNGAGGNIAAGKYNDGSRKMRTVLTDRMEDGMQRAWESTKRTPLTANQVDWKVTTVSIPVASHLSAVKLREQIKEFDAASTAKFAPKLAWLERDTGEGVPIELSCLYLGDARLVHMPGELFVEYQLAAQKMSPDNTVCMAAYGDYAPGYIGTEIAYSQGGYETSPNASNVSPAVEQVLLAGLKKLLAP